MKNSILIWARYPSLNFLLLCKSNTYVWWNGIQEWRGLALPLFLLLASSMSRGHCQKQCNRLLTCLLSSFSAWLPNRWEDLSFCSTVSSKHPVTHCYKHVSFFGGFGQHCLQERRDVTGCSNQPPTGFPRDCVSMCQNHRWGTWRTISNHSSSTSELMMASASLRASPPVWAEDCQRTWMFLGVSGKNQFGWPEEQQKVHGVHCDARSKGSYMSVFHLSNVPLSSCPSSH